MNEHTEPVTLEQYQQIYDLWIKSQDRVDAIVKLCQLDGMLESLLKSVMIDDKVVEELMTDGQALQSFSLKVRLAYALGLIPETAKKDLKLINDIRNAFAHKQRVNSFKKSPVCDWCRELSTAKRTNAGPFDPKVAYERAINKSFIFLLSEMLTRGKLKADSSLQPRYEEVGRLTAEVGEYGQQPTVSKKKTLKRTPKVS